jgi:hypothetical protein
MALTRAARGTRTREETIAAVKRLLTIGAGDPGTPR